MNYTESSRETECHDCGNITICTVKTAVSPEAETGYVDEYAICPDCADPNKPDDCVFCGRTIMWADDADIDEDTERVCFDCDRQRDDARRDEAMGL